MPVFAYSGQLRSTNAISGTLEAENAEAAMAELQSVGVRVTSLAPTAAMLPARPAAARRPRYTRCCATCERLAPA